MKRYKLIKELPFVKIGTELKYDKREYWYTITLDNQNVPTYCFGEDEMEDLVKQGWVEEIKPREIFVWENPSTKELSQIHYFSEEKALRAYKSEHGRIFKFVEVVDE